MRNRCKHGCVIDPDDPCPECERDALREENDRLRAALRDARALALEEAAKLADKSADELLLDDGGTACACLAREIRALGAKNGD